MGRQAVLRFDGIYSLPHESGVSFVLRFYEDGMVCGGYVTENPAELKDIFNKQTANHGTSSFSKHGTQITFSFINEDGSIDYQCKLLGNKLLCNILSTITHKNMKWVYKFTEFAK